MRAAPADQVRLLDLQAVDLTLDQLAHRRRTLPEHAEAAAVEATLSDRRDAVTRARMAVDDIDRQIARVEKDVDLVRTRADRDRKRMDSGAVPAKELESLQHELVSLARRQSELEDTELEFMEQRETDAASLAEAQRALAAAEETLAAILVRRDAALADVDAQLAERGGARPPLAERIPADLLALYERIRGGHAGIGAAVLRHRRCGGCRIELSGTDLAAAKAADADEVLRCDECGRILVRTDESGL